MKNTIRSSSLLIEGFIQKDSETLHRKTFYTYVHVDNYSINLVNCMFCLLITYLAFKLRPAVTNVASKQMLTSIFANILTRSKD